MMGSNGTKAAGCVSGSVKMTTWRHLIRATSDRIADSERRIERQRRFIADLARDGDDTALAEQGLVLRAVAAAARRKGEREIRYRSGTCAEENRPEVYAWRPVIQDMRRKAGNGDRYLLRSSSKRVNDTGIKLFSSVRGANKGVLLMSGSDVLTYSVSETGIFIHFIASDGSETQIDALTVLDCSSVMTNKPLLHWCYERLEEAAVGEMPDEVRWDILASLDEIVAAREAEFEEAQAAGAYLVDSGDALAIMAEWVRRAERAADASSILLTREAFRALLTLAKKGASLPGPSEGVLADIPSQAWDCCS